MTTGELTTKLIESKPGMVFVKMQYAGGEVELLQVDKLEIEGERFFIIVRAEDSLGFDEKDWFRV